MTDRLAAHREREKKRYAEDTDFRRRKLARNRAYVIAHKEEINARRREREAADPEHREKKRMRRYGMSRAEYEAIAMRQGGACAICRKKLGRGLCVDHCHSSGKVRGLLCRKCNSGLGFYRNSPARLRAAAEYLKRFRKPDDDQ